VNILDFIFIIILAFNIIIGFKNGAIRMIGNIISLFASYFVSKYIYESTSLYLNLLKPVSGNEAIYRFALIFTMVFIAFQITVWFFHHAMDWSGAGFLNHSLGLVLGFVRGFLFCIMLALPLSITEAKMYEESSLAKKIEPVTYSVVLTIHENDSSREFFKNFDLDTNKIAKMALSRNTQSNQF
jgi:uncharacterized membrane protein required for colicin V production